MYTPVDGHLEILCAYSGTIHRTIVLHYATNSNIEDFFEDE